jgi:hypothetical protein
MYSYIVNVTKNCLKPFPPPPPKRQSVNLSTCCFFPVSLLPLRLRLSSDTLQRMPLEDSSTSRAYKNSGHNFPTISSLPLYRAYIEWVIHGIHQDSCFCHKNIFNKSYFSLRICLAKCIGSVEKFRHFRRSPQLPSSR